MSYSHYNFPIPECAIFSGLFKIRQTVEAKEDICLQECYHYLYYKFTMKLTFNTSFSVLVWITFVVESSLTSALDIIRTSLTSVKSCTSTCKSNTYIYIYILYERFILLESRDRCKAFQTADYRWIYWTLICMCQGSLLDSVFKPHQLVNNKKSRVYANILIEH